MTVYRNTFLCYTPDQFCVQRVTRDGKIIIPVADMSYARKWINENIQPGDIYEEAGTKGVYATLTYDELMAEKEKTDKFWSGALVR